MSIGNCLPLMTPLLTPPRPCTSLNSFIGLFICYVMMQINLSKVELHLCITDQLQMLLNSNWTFINLYIVSVCMVHWKQNGRMGAGWNVWHFYKTASLVGYKHLPFYLVLIFVYIWVEPLCKGFFHLAYPLKMIIVIQFPVFHLNSLTCIGSTLKQDDSYLVLSQSKVLFLFVLCELHIV